VISFYSQQRIRNNSRFILLLSSLRCVYPPFPKRQQSADALIFAYNDVSHNKVAAKRRRLTSAVRVNWIPHDRLLTSPSGLKRGRAFSGFPGSAPELTLRIVTSRARFAPNLSREIRGNEENRGRTENWPASSSADLSRLTRTRVKTRINYTYEDGSCRTWGKVCD